MKLDLLLAVVCFIDKETTLAKFTGF
jgi:hypothetical protein